MTDLPAVAIYAALSRKKPKRGDDDRTDEESVDSQIAKVQARLDQGYGEGGYDLLGVFKEAGHSGSKKNRGPELERAIAAVTAAADERATVELWANTSARFARGTGKRNEARAIGELFYDLRRRGVALRTVADDEFVTNELLIGFASRQASKYAEDLAESVKRAKRRQAERGERLGGPLPIGYVEGSNPSARDPATAPTVERIMELALQGVPDGLLARTVNREGHRSRSGRPFDRRSVQAIVLNPMYAGLVPYDGEEFPARDDYPRFVDADDWRRMVAARDTRDLGSGRHTAGAPARLHLLSRLAECGRCRAHARMNARTSAYVRKDGSKQRTYLCRNVDLGLCDSGSVDAELVDTAVMKRLHDLLPDFEQWIEQIEDRHADERRRIAELVDKAEHDRDAQQRTAEAHERRYRDAVAAGDDAKADLLLGFVEEARSSLDAAELRLTASQDALASVPAHAPRDRLLDFAIDLRDAIRGKTTAAHSVEDVNRALIETFDSFLIWDDRLPLIPEFDTDPSLPGLTEDQGIHAGAIKIVPNIRPEVVQALLDAARERTGEEWPSGPLVEAEPVPMAWIEAMRISDHSHPYCLAGLRARRGACTALGS